MTSRLVMTSQLDLLHINLSIFKDDEWAINETYMDNIAKYPKDWYQQMTKGKKHSRSKSEPEKSSKKEVETKQRNSIGSEAAAAPETTEEETEDAAVAE